MIEGMGELHLDIIVDRLKREFKVDCTVGAPQVNYREKMMQPAGPPSLAASVCCACWVRCVMLRWLPALWLSASPLLRQCVCA